MSKKYIHAENNHNILSSNEVRLYNPPKPEEMTIIIWNKELCNGAEWADFLRCVEEKTKENEELKQQLAEKDKEIEDLSLQIAEFNSKITQMKEQDMIFHNQLAIQELEKVKNLAVVLLDGFCHSIHYSQKEFRGHRYIEFYDLIRGIDNQITELGGESNEN